MATAEETAPKARVAQARVVATAEETAAVARVAEARVVVTAEETAESVRVGEARVVAGAEETAVVASAAEARVVVARAEQSAAEARVAEARVVATAEETAVEGECAIQSSLYGTYKLVQPPTNGQITCRPTKIVVDRASVEQRMGASRVLGKGHATWTTRLQAKAEAKRLAGRMHQNHRRTGARWAFEGTGKRICVRN